MLSNKNTITNNDNNPIKHVEEMEPGEFGQIIDGINAMHLGSIVFRPYIPELEEKNPVQLVKLSSGSTWSGKPPNFKVKILTDIRITRENEL